MQEFSELYGHILQHNVMIKELCEEAINQNYVEKIA